MGQVITPTDLAARLSKLPRFPLAQLPTPVQPLKNFEAELAGPQIWMKRDDLTGLEGGGNKTRKLEYVVGDALRQGCDMLVTVGAIQSNHTRQTAAAAAKANLKCALLHCAWTKDAGPHYREIGNLLLSSLMGAYLYVDESPRPIEDQGPLDDFMAHLKSQGHNPYLIPGGASEHPLGSMGCINCAIELAVQAEQLGVEFDYLVGGKRLVILLGLTVAFMLMQNAIGAGGTLAFGLPVEVGVLLGTASLIGGHWTAIAWGPTIEAQTGFAAAAEIGVAAATLGLILAALPGGPIAKFLVEGGGLTPAQGGGNVVGLPFEEEGKVAKGVDHISLMRSMLAAHIAIILGFIANEAIAEAGLKLPLFVPCLLVGIVMSNTIPFVFPSLPWPARSKSLALVSDYCLSVFLAMSLMSLLLWTLASLGGPLLAVLLAQAAVTAAFIIVLFFQIMGGEYDAAVLSAGFAGFGLGATPTAIANMSAVTKRYGPAPIAFIILPLVSAFFVDLANAAIIQIFLSF